MKHGCSLKKACAKPGRAAPTVNRQVTARWPCCSSVVVQIKPQCGQSCAQFGVLLLQKHPSKEGPCSVDSFALEAPDSMHLPVPPAPPAGAGCAQLALCSKPDGAKSTAGTAGLAVPEGPLPHHLGTASPASGTGSGTFSIIVSMEQ